jgi:hypothetical protein
MTERLVRVSRTGVKRKATVRRVESCAHTSKRRRTCAFCCCSSGPAVCRRGEGVQRMP